jgi:hypothetical protein
MSGSSSTGAPIQITPVGSRNRRWWHGVLAFAFGFGGRLVVFGILAFLFVLAGALVGVWSYADDERLPSVIEDSRLFRPYVAALDQRRRQAVDTRAEVQAWRAEVTERLQLIGNDLRQAKGSIGEITTAVQGLEGDVVYGANYQWCGGLRLHGRWSDDCADLVARGEVPADYQFTETEGKGDP